VDTRHEPLTRLANASEDLDVHYWRPHGANIAFDPLSYEGQTPTETARAFLQDYARLFRLHQFSSIDETLVKVRVAETPVGTSVVFRQHWKGYPLVAPIFGST
jgi:hypothetical protein